MSDEIGPEEERARKHERGAWRRRALSVLPFVVLVGLLAWGFSTPRNSTQDSERVGGERPGAVPDFELELLGGGTLSSDDLRGGPVVLNFWASWCIPCREEMPAFERMWARYRDEGIQIIGVNLKDSERGAREFVEDIGVTYPIALDHSGDLATDLGVRGLPQTFFIDENLRFEKISAAEAVDGGGERVVFGAIDEAALEEQIQNLLEEID